MTRFRLKQYFNFEPKLVILKNQVEHYGKFVQAICSHSYSQQSKAGKKSSDSTNIDELSPTKKTSVSEENATSTKASDANWISQLVRFDNVLKPAMDLYKRILPLGYSKNGPSPATTQSLVEIAMNLRRSTAIGMQEWSLGDLTLGLYLLSLRHASEMAVDNIRGKQITSELTVQELIYYVELAKGSYLKDAAALARHSMLRESQVLKFVNNSNVMRPGYYIAVDNRHKLVILGIRGTHTVHDIVTDMVSLSNNQGASFDGFNVHFGTSEAARWFFSHELQTLRECLETYKGFQLRLVGHSLGGAAAALLAMMIRKTSESDLGFNPNIVSAVGFATPPCVPKKLAKDCQDFVTSVVLQDDAIPRMSSASLARLRNEILLTDWTNVLDSDKAKSIIELVTNTVQALSSVQEAARKYATFANLKSDKDCSADECKENTSTYKNNKDQLSDASSNTDSPEPIQLKPVENKNEELFAPGTLYHIRGRCLADSGKKMTAGKENCTLWKGYPDEHFGRIVLTRSMLTDHKCDSHYYALRDVLKGLPISVDDR